MPTVCEITAQLKERKIKGYSGKTKAQMISMLEGKTPAKKETKKTSKKEPKLLTDKKLDDDKYTGKSFIFLKKLASKLEALANDKNATESERVVAERKLKRVADARDEAKKNQYSKKKKK
jgi:hypothetical protein